MNLSTIFTQCAPKTTTLGKINQNKGHFAVQGHSRSPILVPIESSYTASYIKTVPIGKYCALRLEFMNLLQNLHHAVIEYLHCGHRAVPLQTFSTRHSNRKLSIVMALSTTFTQCTRKLTNSAK